VRAVVDTNVLVSALMKSATPPAAVVAAWHGEAFDLVSSPPLLAELLEVLERRHVRKYIVDLEFERQLVARIRQDAIVVEPTESLALSDDPDDDRILEAAVAGGADYIVTGDDDLLRLREVRGTRICTPAQFLIELAARE
jgi:putative PIN family toxin of toxin-antitoxin system